MPTLKPPHALDLASELTRTAETLADLADRIEATARAIRVAMLRPRHWESAGQDCAKLLQDALSLSRHMATADTLRRLQGKG